ncbi:glycerophosphoryl diester phosphodiesterase membrane domain-containing protein [Curtobacterium luteum]|uniref:glycerophosphoryl diester phosphodiesterase membrane domain-containing protein n=1 Tax=Curtobacterium luteum TaxID=33881 RepID=UPI003823B22A
MPLRPLGLGDVLGGAFTVFRRNARVLLLWSFLVTGVVGVLAKVVSTLAQGGLQSRMFSSLDSAGSSSDAASIAAGTATAFVLLSVGLPFVAALFRGFLLAPVAVDTGQRVLGRRATFRGIWALLAGRRWSVVAWVLLQAAAGVLLGGVFLVLFIGFVAGLAGSRASFGWFLLAAVVVAIGGGVLSTWLTTKFAFTIPTIALEGRGVFSAAAQSWRLTRGAFWRTFGIMLLVTAMFAFAVSIASFPLQVATVFVSGVFDPLGQTSGSSGPGVWSVVVVVLGALLVTAVQCVTDVLSGSVLTLLAIDRRIRTEGLDQRIAAHLDTGQPADPFAPAAALPVRPPQQPWGPQQPWEPQPPQWQQQQQWAPPPQWGGPR